MIFFSHSFTGVNLNQPQWLSTSFGAKEQKWFAQRTTENDLSHVSSNPSHWILFGRSNSTRVAIPNFIVDFFLILFTIYRTCRELSSHIIENAAFPLVREKMVVCLCNLMHWSGVVVNGRVVGVWWTVLATAAATVWWRHSAQCTVV